MAKKSRKKPAHPQQNNRGCMWGLISLFDFRRGYPTQKLLSDKKHGSTKQTGNGYSRIKLDSRRDIPDKHVATTLVDELREEPLTFGFTSVKALMEEEMSRHPQTKIASDEAHGVESDLIIEVIPKRNHEQRSKKLKLGSDMQRNNMEVSSSFDGLQSDSVDLTGRSSINFDLAKFLVDFYSYTCQQMHADSNNKLDCLPASGIIGRINPNYLDEQLDQNISFFQQILADVAQAIASQKSSIEEQPDGRCVFHHKEFMDALETLNSDKELLLKLLQDPDSFLLEYIRNLLGSPVRKISQLGSERYLDNIRLLNEENICSGKCKELDGDQILQKQNKYSFFRRKGKSKGTMTSEEIPSSKVLNRIVVLKPNPVGIPNSSAIDTPNCSPQSQHVRGHDENGERIISHFSLKEIKRRIQHKIGESRKTQHVISMDGLLHRIPVRSISKSDPSKRRNSESALPSSATNSSCDPRVMSKSLSLDSSKDETLDSAECEVNINSPILSSTSRSQFPLYEEAKKHLAEMLNSTRVNDLPKAHHSESLGRVLSLPRDNEFCSISNPQRDEDLIMSSEETGDPSSLQLQQEELVDTNMVEISRAEEDLNRNESTEIIEAVDTESIVEFNQLDVASVSSKDELTILNKICEEESSSLYLDSPEEKSPNVTKSKLPPTLIRENLAATESTSEKLEQPSPVSVLETFLPEDITSPESTTMEDCDIHVEHEEVNYEGCDTFLRIEASPGINDSSRDGLADDEARLDYVKAVLEASGLTNEFSERWDVEDQLLESSLFDEIGFFFCFLQDDPKLLFDCMNEVLIEIQKRFLICSPWETFFKQNITPVPLGESLIQEVSKGLEWHLHIQVPSTLDQVISKDLKGRSWMDLRFEAENITGKICDKILNDLVEESVYDIV